MDFPSFNKVMLIGRIVRGPKIDEVNGKTKGWLAMETQRDWNETTYKDSIGATVWGKAVESLRSLSEGDIVYLEGRIGRRKYEQDGETKWTTEVTASSVAKVGASSAQDPGYDDSDVPF